MMNPVLLLICGIAFVVVGLIFAAAGFYLKQPSSVEKAPISAAAGSIFYIIGAMTLIAGIFAIAFHNGADKKIVQACLLLYLAAVTVLLFVFTALIKDKNGK